MKTSTENYSPFKIELRENVRKCIRKAIKDGTTGMSVENLMQCVHAPSRELEGSINGTNARYFYAQMFREVCESKDIAPFIIG